MISNTWLALLLGAVATSDVVTAFTTTTRSQSQCLKRQSATQLFEGGFVSVGLGPQEETTEDGEKKEEKELVAGVDYEVPDHEAYRTSRRAPIDEQCDKWFGELLGDEDQTGVLTSLAKDARKMLLTPVPLVNEVCSHCELLCSRFICHLTYYLFLFCASGTTPKRQ